MRIIKKIIRKIYHLIWFLSIFLFFVPNVYAVSFSTNGYSCINFYNGTQYCSNVRQFDYDNIPYYGADFSYTPDNFDEVNTTVIDFFNQSFCSNDSSGGFLNFRLYHNYSFTNSALNFIQASVSGKNYLCTSTISQDGRYSEVSCPIASSFSNQTLTFSFKFNDLYFGFPFTSGFSNLLVESCNISTGDIINSQNQNTQDIINNQNQNNQNIINNNNSNTNQIIQNNEQNTQDIIDNQNENSEKEIESQKVCKYIDKSNIVLDNKYLSNNGEVFNTNGVGITDYININSSTIKVLDPVVGSANSCFYNSNKELISCINLSNTSGTITIPNKSQYFRATISKSQNKPTFNICQNGNQALTDTLTDDTTPNIDLNLTTASDTPISDLITMPLTILNGLYQTLTDSCTNYTLPFFYSTTITFPCFTISDYLGTNITNYIDLFICLYMCYNIAMLVISVFEDITSLRDIYDSLYEPKHAYTGYHPKHAKGE